MVDYRYIDFNSTHKSTKVTAILLMSLDVFIIVDGARVRARPSAKLGEDYAKPVVLLFHGFSFSLDVWADTGILQLLSDRGYSYLAMDLPKGNASRSDKFGRKNFSDYILFLNKALSHFLDLEKAKFVLLGASMGGGFALALALENQKRISGMVLIAPSIKGISEESLGELDVPTLLIWGERDTIFPVDEYGNRLKEIMPRSKLLIIKGARHAAYLDKPQEFHELLVDFLDEIS
ncbi:MAG: alpha/beta fold hydrolase [Nitrososphaerales archaeon]